MTPPTSWPIASQLLFLANPQLFPLVKPRKVQRAFEVMGLHNLRNAYSSNLNFGTYDAVRRGYNQIKTFIMSHFTEDEIRIDDLIDIQTIIFILAGGYGQGLQEDTAQ